MIANRQMSTTNPTDAPIACDDRGRTINADHMGSEGEVTVEPGVPGLDTDVPVLLVKLGRHPYHHGALAAVRSLGRAGVPTYAITEDPYTPVARSRYLTGRFAWPTVGTEKPEQIVDRLLRIGARIGRPTVAIATDDAAAVLLAEHADALRPQFLLPRVPPDLPRTLANKEGMYELCLRASVPTPRTSFPSTVSEAVKYARELTYPVVAKNTEPWTPRAGQLVKCTTVIADEHELLQRFDGLPSLNGLLLQEYIPHEESEDWFVGVHASAGAALRFVGRKARAWPPRSGVTADGRATPNATLSELTARFVEEIGWQGPASMDWRLDLRDGRYLLVDFNVRVGAQFRCGQTENGVDLVRAVHLDLTGRRVPAVAQDYTRRILVGNLLLPSLVGERVSRLPRPPRPRNGSRTERAWIAADDPVPAVIMLTRGARSVAASMSDTWRTWRLRRRTLAASPTPDHVAPA
jgi:D-aspartate ligase